MRGLTKVALVLAVLFLTIGMAPAAKADPIQLSALSGGFNLQNLGNDGSIPNGMDGFMGAAWSTHRLVFGNQSFVSLLNPLIFTTGHTGLTSGGPHLFDFFQPLTINGLTQDLHLFGSIDIGSAIDTIHVNSSAPLTFNFSTFSVSVSVVPLDIQAPGANGGVFCDRLRARFTVTRNCGASTVPEPASLTLLGAGLALGAAEFRKRRKRAASPAA